MHLNPQQQKKAVDTLRILLPFKKNLIPASILFSLIYYNRAM
jgi:hypothetical protein